MQDAIQFWDSAAEKYAKSKMQDVKSYEYTLERTKSYLSLDDHVLELGCGTGSTSLLLAPFVRHVTATDISGNMIKIGKEKAKAEDMQNIDFLASDLFSVSKGAGAYDAVLALNLIHLLEDTPAVMEHIHALLKPGGVFISKTVCKADKAASFKVRLMLLALPIAQFLGKAPYVKFMEIAELEDHVTEAGFEILETNSSSSSPTSRYIVARKLA